MLSQFVGAQPAVKLVPEDVGEFDRFGNAVAISGETLIVGSINHDLPAEDAGAAYVYRFEEGLWILEEKLTPDGVQQEDRFGISVAIDGDLAVVGAIGNDEKGSNAGAAYVYQRQGTSWALQAKLTADDGNENDAFGFSVAMHGNTVLVGARNADINGVATGAAYLFHGFETGWVQLSKLVSDQGPQGEGFGTAVAVNDAFALVGALLADGVEQHTGAVYVFQNQGIVWRNTDKLVARDGSFLDLFGSAVSMSGPYVLVGAKSNDSGGVDAGAAYVFEYQETGFVEVEKLAANDGITSNRFGESVAIDGGHAVVGAPEDDDSAAGAGAAYVFEKVNERWSQVEKLARTSTPNAGFGASVAIDDGRAIVGAAEDDVAGIVSGTSHVFDLTSVLTDTELVHHHSGLLQVLDRVEVFPNPFLKSVALRFALYEAAWVNVCIYDVLGKRVQVLFDGIKYSGTHQVIWDGLDKSRQTLPAGLYVMHIQTPSSHRTIAVVKS